MTWGQCSGEVVVGNVAMQADAGDDGVVVGVEVWIVVSASLIASSTASTDAFGGAACGRR
jgi:hypothetical protein